MISYIVLYAHENKMSIIVKKIPAITTSTNVIIVRLINSFFVGNDNDFTVSKLS